MSKKREDTTTIERVLKPSVHKIASKYIRRYGTLNRVLSAAVLALDRLPPEDREILFEEINKPSETANPGKFVKDVIENMKKRLPLDEGGERFIIPDSETQAEINELRDLLGPEPKKKIKNA